MKIRNILLISLVVTVLLWALFSWPLPRYLASGIPSSARNVETPPVREMIPGDHLQLMYYFWLAGDMAIGRTPLFHDVYQFNPGDDAVRYRPHHYFVPFSLVFSAAASLGGRPFGWNLTALLSLWLTCLFTYLLVRRYVADERVAWLATLFGLLLPFRWVKLLGGSPMGFGLGWLPLYFLGLDKAVRDKSFGGGCTAGIALLLLRFGDLHLFYFSALLTPFWCVIALIRAEAFRWRSPREYLRMLRPLAPIAVFAALALLYTLQTQQRVAESMQATGRSLSETALFAPHWLGLWCRRSFSTTSHHIYIGYVTPALMLAGTLVLLLQAVRRKPGAGRRLALMVLLALAMTGLVLLALGPQGPFGGRAFALARQIIPRYRMVRQPAKAFCLMPVLLPMVAAIAASACATLLRRKRALIACLLATAALLVVDFRRQISPTICLLDGHQDAYAAVAEDSPAGKPPHVIIIPLWPGDAAWSSLYQYYASLYRIRMVNGYHPIVDKTYFGEVFERFESINKGYIVDDQLDALLERGITYLILHEDAFPEKVSPFPAAFTLQQLLDHPRLQFLKQSGPAWAFKILPDGRTTANRIVLCDQLFPARRWDADSFDRYLAGLSTDAGDNAFVTIAEDRQYIEVGPRSMAPVPALRWMIRTRGEGVLDAEGITEKEVLPLKRLRVNTPEWRWLELPFPLQNHRRASLKLWHKKGRVDISTVVLAAGRAWTSPEPGRMIELRAPEFFHAGFTDIARDSVIITKDREPRSIVFYGPKLPLDVGTYDIELVFSSSAEPGTSLGQFNMRTHEADEEGWVQVEAGRPARHRFVQEENLPVFLAFLFEREGDIEVQKITLSRVE